MMILEKINELDYETKQNKTVELFFGRFNPLHRGHVQIIKSMKNPIVVIVKGKKSDKEKNPLNLKEQLALFKKVLPGLKIIVAPTGYLPDIINTIRKLKFEVNKLYVGADRIEDYKKQFKGFNLQVPENKKIDVEFVKTPRITSATVVRKAIRDSDFEVFKKNMPKELWTEWDNLKRILSRN